MKTTKALKWAVILVGFVGCVTHTYGDEPEPQADVNSNTIEQKQILTLSTHLQELIDQQQWESALSTIDQLFKLDPDQDLTQQLYLARFQVLRRLQHQEDLLTATEDYLQRYEPKLLAFAAPQEIQIAFQIQLVRAELLVGFEKWLELLQLADHCLDLYEPALDDAAQQGFEFMRAKALLGMDKLAAADDWMHIALGRNSSTEFAKTHITRLAQQIQQEKEKHNQQQTKLYPVRVQDKWGFINPTGTLVIEPQFDYAGSFNEGLAKVEINEMNGFINTTGDYIVKPIYQYAGHFSEGLAEVMNDMKRGFVDKSGTLAIPLQFDGVWSFADGLVRISMNKQYGYADRHGVTIIPPQYTQAGHFGNGLACVQKGEKWGFINPSNEWVIEPQYDEAKSFTEGLAAVKTGEKWGYINPLGTFVIKPRFEQAYFFNEGLAVVQEDGQQSYIDTSGKIVITGHYDLIMPFSEGRAVVVKNYRYGYIDVNGKLVTKIIYNNASGFHLGLGKVTVYDDEMNAKDGYVDRTGNMVWAPTD